MKLSGNSVFSYHCQIQRRWDMVNRCSPLQRHLYTLRTPFSKVHRKIEEQFRSGHRLAHSLGERHVNAIDTR